MNSYIKPLVTIAVVAAAMTFTAHPSYAEMHPHSGKGNAAGCCCCMKTTDAECPVCVAPAMGAKPAMDSHDLSTFQMKGYVDEGKAIILDARSGKYDDGDRIPGAQSINSESSAEEVAKVIPAKDSLVITYCSNLQCPASNMLAEHLKTLGYTNILEYPEGIAGWKAAGGEVSKAKQEPNESE